MDSLEVLAGTRCGPFVLGMSLFAALGVLKKPEFQGLTFSSSLNTQIIFSAISPTESPVVVDIQSLGLRLRFESRGQTLCVVEVYDVRKVPVSFKNTSVGGPEGSSELVTLRGLYPVLGATHAGFQKEDEFCFQYPGFLIQFRVPVDEVFQGIPFTLKNGESPQLARFFVHDLEFGGEKYNKSTLTLVEVTIQADDVPQVIFAEITIRLGETTGQDVLFAFGAPTSTFLKKQSAFGEDSEGDYFLNYFSRGVDVLLDGTLHVVRKVILRTNLVCHPLFNRYAKCAFVIKYLFRRRTSPSVASPPKSSGALASFEELLLGGTTSQSTSPVKRSPKTILVEKKVGCDEAWETAIAPKLDLRKEKPMVHEVPEQPFGPCLLFGFAHSVFEVHEKSQCLASFTVF